MKRSVWLGMLLLFVGLAGSVSAQTAAQYIAAGNQSYAAKDYAKGVQYYQTAAQMDPNSAAAYQGLGNCQYMLGQNSEALSAYEKALNLSPNNAQLSGFVQTLRAKVGTSAPSSASAPTASSPENTSAGMSEKSPILAGVLSWLIPGLGQYYNGRPEDITKGLIIDGAAVGGIVLIVIGASSAVNSATKPVTTYAQAQQQVSGIGGDATLALVGWGLYVGADVFGIVDGIMSADDINNHRLKPRTDNNFKIAPTIFVDSTYRAVPAMTLSMRF